MTAVDVVGRGVVEEPMTPERVAGETDSARLARMLADWDDLKSTFEALRRAHLMDGGGPLFESFTRLSVALDMDGVEIRHIKNLLGGTK